MSNQVKDNVLHIVNNIESHFEGETNQDGGELTAFDYVCEALDIEYIIGSDGEYRGARILVAFGGPNIWINTKTSQVEGYWWGDSCIMSFDDEVGLDEACEELYACLA